VRRQGDGAVSDLVQDSDVVALEHAEVDDESGGRIQLVQERMRDLLES
jgi:hypothetical protein